MAEPLNIPPRSIYVMVTDEHGNSMLGTEVRLTRAQFEGLRRLSSAPWWEWVPKVARIFRRGCQRQMRLLAKCPPVRFPAAK